MDLADRPISHSARADMFQREATWRLGPEALEREGGEPADAALAALLVFVLALVGGVAITDLFLVKLGVIVAFIPVMIAYTRKNRPGSFDPKVLPEKVLPGG
jgi:hypothetical protein